MNDMHTIFAWLGESRVVVEVWKMSAESGGSLKSCGLANYYPLRTVTSLTLWIATMK